MAVIDLANPTRFLTLVNRVLPWLAALTIALFIVGLVHAMQAPDDYQQGATVKIMFLHVPAAWLSMMGWGVMSLAALGTLVWRHPLADVAAKAAAPVGAAFTFICLVTGSLWGRPTWGTYWVWDARLTSVLVLFLLYLGVLALYWTTEDPGRGSRAAAVLTLVGAVNIPIIKFSVDWWNTLHQPASILRMGGNAIDPSILWPLLIMAVAFTLLFFTLHIEWLPPAAAGRAHPLEATVKQFEHPCALNLDAMRNRVGLRCCLHHGLDRVLLALRNLVLAVFVGPEWLVGDVECGERTQRKRCGVELVELHFLFVEDRSIGAVIVRVGHYLSFSGLRMVDRLGAGCAGG